MRVIAVIDGEHHPGVARDTLDRIASEHDLCAVLFAGGEEKVGEQIVADPVAHYGRDVTVFDSPTQGLRELADAADPEAVIDISGEPVLDGEARFRLASVALHLGLEYRTAGFRLTPPAAERLPTPRPVIAVIGTGKRTGKTAIAGHYATLLAERGLVPVMVCMGRGGPAEPQLVRAEDRPDLAALREIVRAGGHAASDYLEDAVLTGVSCIGCRRCGEGPAGEPFASNVLEGAELALTLDPDVLLLEGSGAALPPIEADRTLCVTSAPLAERQALSHLGPYRLLRSDVVTIVGADALDKPRLAELKRALGEWCDHDRLVGCRLEPEPADAIGPDARVAVFTTAPRENERELRAALGDRDVEVRVLSTSLARRAQLERDLERAAAERCDVYLTEIKAAAIEIVAERAAEVGAELVFLRNRPVSLAGEPDLDDELLRLVEEVGAEASGASAEETAFQ
jgi:cyclic 2,3-diphosphoglycerate synthetase